MANRRMFTLDIIDSDKFLSLKSSTQALYFQIGMRCDDDGICDNVLSIIGLIGAEKDCLKELLDNHLILGTDIGVYIVKHWWLHNTKRTDRYIASRYLRKLKLYLDENGAYTFNKTKLAYSADINPATELATNKATKKATKSAPQDKLSKVKLSKVNISKVNNKENILTTSVVADIKETPTTADEEIDYVRNEDGSLKYDF